MPGCGAYRPIHGAIHSLPLCRREPGGCDHGTGCQGDASLPAAPCSQPPHSFLTPLPAVPSVLYLVSFPVKGRDRQTWYSFWDPQLYCLVRPRPQPAPGAVSLFTSEPQLLHTDREISLPSREDSTPSSSLTSVGLSLLFLSMLSPQRDCSKM